MYHKIKYKTRELGRGGGRETMDLIYNALESKPWCLD